MTRSRWLPLAVERLEDRTTPSTGGLLDPTFGSGGHVLSSFTNHSDGARAITEQPDGKIVIAGDTTPSGSHTGADFLVARYNPDGSVDTAFGSGGHAATDFKGGTDTAHAVAVQADGKILAAGHVFSSIKRSTASYDFGLARYNANGTLDTTFGSKGKVMTDFGGAGESAMSMLVDGAGRILVAGNTDATGSPHAVLARYTANGALDPTFGNGGKLVTNIPLVNGTVQIALQADGKIVLAGNKIDPATSTYEFFAARFNANGTTDSGFGTGGMVTSHPGTDDSFGGLAIQGDGKILLSGSENDSRSPFALYLLRDNADGTPDTGFGTGGLVILPSPSGGVLGGSGVAVQSDGKIVAGGEFPDSTTQQEMMAAARVNADGSVDTGYGNGGWATVQFASNDELRAIALQPDGRFLLAGTAEPVGGSLPIDIALARFLPSAPQIGSFTASPNPASVGSPVTLTAGSLTDGNPGATVTQVAFYTDTNGDGVLDAGDAQIGTATPNSDGTWTFTLDTTGWAAGSYTLFAQATDSFGGLGDPMATTLQLL